MLRRFHPQPYLQNVAVILYFFSSPLVLVLSLIRVANEEQHFDENLVLASSAETLNELCVPVDWVHKVENCISQIRDRTIFKFKFNFFSLALPLATLLPASPVARRRLDNYQQLCLWKFI